MTEALWLALSQPFTLSIFAALCGLIFGGLATVAGDRLGQIAVAEDAGEEPPEQMGLWYPASRCEQCGRPLTVLERAPGIGWLVAKGECWNCGYKVPLIHPISEWLCAALFGYVALTYGPSWETLFLLFASWAYVTLALADLRHFVLPDSLTLPLLWVGLIGAALVLPLDPGMAILGAAAGYGFMWLLQEVHYRIKGVVGIGGGDLKLVAAIGAWAGLELIFLTAAAAAILGIVVFALAAAFPKAEEGYRPFGPMLALVGGWVTIRPEDFRALLELLARLIV